MANCYFAQINPNTNEVTDCFVVGGDVSTDAGPLEDNPMHVDGETYCRKTLKIADATIFKQFSKTSEFRYNSASKGSTWDPVNEAFIDPQPVGDNGDEFSSWTLDANFKWQPPTPYPSVLDYTNDGGQQEEYRIRWEEDIQKWSGGTRGENYTTSHWNGDTLAWEVQ